MFVLKPPANTQQLHIYVYSVLYYVYIMLNWIHTRVRTHTHITIKLTSHEWFHGLKMLGEVDQAQGSLFWYFSCWKFSCHWQVLKQNICSCLEVKYKQIRTMILHEFHCIDMEHLTLDFYGKFYLIWNALNISSTC